MALSSTVWMVHARTGLAGIKGVITLEGQDLVFRPEPPSPGASTFRLDDVRRVRRVRGSPVLEIYLRAADAPPVVGFYFVRPPSLEESYEGWGGPFRRRSARKRALFVLHTANVQKKTEVERWVQHIESRRAG